MSTQRDGYRKRAERAEARRNEWEARFKELQESYCGGDMAAAEARLSIALGLLNRWLSQHRDGGATDPCGVAPELVAETRDAVRK